MLNGKIVVIIYYGQLFQVFGKDKQKEVEKCLMKQIVMLFMRDNPIKLTDDIKQNY